MSDVTSVPDSASQPPVLLEAELFQPKIKSGHRLRMAATWLVDEYKQMRGGSLSNSDHFIPAYAAHVLWTQAGNRIATQIPATPEFSRPEQVLRRAEDIGQEFPDRVRNLLARVARSATVPQPARYWAQRFEESRL